MLQKSTVLRLFRAFSLQRWNDQIRPVPLVEMDKHAHKMATAYCLARSAEDAGRTVEWSKLIAGGIFELLRRIVLSDIKSPIYHRIKDQQPDVFKNLSSWVYEQLEADIGNDKVLAELRAYLIDDTFLDDLSKDILSAAHNYASLCEFQIIRGSSPETESMRRIEHTLLLDMAPHRALPGLSALLYRDKPYAFLDLFGQLRYQTRWSQTPRLPSTSVLGHCMMVAAVTYMLTRELPQPACGRRLRNNFFSGLFHDLPEAVTRDIISPVKGAIPTLKAVITTIERELMEKEILPLIPDGWWDEVRYWTGVPGVVGEDWNEFDSKIVDAKKVKKCSSSVISERYNDDKYCPVDGELVKVADHLAAFVEARMSIDAGVNTRDLQEGITKLAEQYKKKKILAGLNVSVLFADLG